MFQKMIPARAACSFIFAMSVLGVPPQASAQLPGDSVVLRYEPASCWCYEVTTPEEWKFRDATSQPGSLEFRMYFGSIKLFGVTAVVENSLNHFTWSPPLSGTVVRATAVPPRLWTSAKPITLHQKSLITDVLAEEKPTHVSYRGRDYRKTGAYWSNSFSAALPSPDGQLLILQSHTGSRVGDREPQTDGKIYIDVYDTNSGKAVCRIQGAHSDYFGAGLLEATSWLSDTLMVASIAPFYMRRFLQCDFSQRGSK